MFKINTILKSLGLLLILNSSLFATVTIGDKVWEDTNGNGIQDNGESGIEGVTIELFKGNTKKASKKSDSNGIFTFDVKIKKKYQLRILLDDNKLQNYKPTLQNIGDTSNNPEGDSKTDNDGDNGILNTGYSTIKVNTEEKNYNYDFGFIPIPTVEVSVGSLVWEDQNHDGLQDDTEIGIEDANVSLLDNNGTVLESQMTDSNGSYYFSALDEGEYSVQVSPPVGYLACTQQNAVVDDTENDSNIAFHSDNNYTSGSFSLQKDTELTESNGKTGSDNADDSDDDNGDMTVDFCFYKASSLGNFVWNDSNKDGIQDGNESGVADVNVTIYNSNDCSGVALGSMVTDSNGSYLFTELKSGDYCLEFSDLPTNYVVSPKNEGTDSELDSDVSTSAPFIIENIELGGGEHNLSWDMGIYLPESTTTSNNNNNSNNNYNYNYNYYYNNDTTSEDDNTTSEDDNVSSEDDNTTISEDDNVSSEDDNTTISEDDNVSSEDDNTTISEDDNVSSEDDNTTNSEDENVTFDVQTLVAQNYEVIANREGSVTTIQILNPNEIDLENHAIFFVNLEGRTFDPNKVMSGKGLELSRETYVEGEGIWRAGNGMVIFNADDGFEDIPSPVYYLVQSVNSVRSNVAEISIITPCVCDSYESHDSVGALNTWSSLLFVFFVSFLAMRKESVE